MPRKTTVLQTLALGVGAPPQVASIGAKIRRHYFRIQMLRFFKSICNGHNAIVAFGVGLRIWWWYAKDFWGDTFALKAGIVTHTFVELLFGPIGFDQTAPLGFTLVSKLLGLCFGYFNHVLTLPCLFAGIVTLLLLDSCLSLCGVEKVRLWFLFLFAIHPSLCYYSAEFKPYAFDALFAAHTFRVVLRCFLSGKCEAGRKMLVPFVLAPFFASTSFFVLPVSFTAIFIRTVVYNRDRHINHKSQTNNHPLGYLVLASTFAMVIAFWHLRSTMPSMMQGFWARDFALVTLSKEGFFWYWNCLARCFRGPVFFVFVPYSPSPLQVLCVVISLGVLLFGIVRACCARTAFLYGFGIVCATLLASMLGKWPVRPGYPTSARLLLHWIPSLTCSLAIGVEELWKRFKYVTLLLLFFCVATSFAFAAKLLFPSMVNSWQSEQAVETMIHKYRHGDIVFVDGYNDCVVRSFAENWFWEDCSNYSVVSNERELNGPFFERLFSRTMSNCFFLFRLSNCGSARVIEALQSESEKLGYDCEVITNTPTVLVFVSQPSAE